MPDSISLDHEVERWVIHAALEDEVAYEQVADLAVEDFSHQAHRMIWEAIQGLHSECRGAGLAEVISSLREAGKLTQAGGLSYLMQIAEGSADVLDVKRHAATVREAAAKRRLSELFTSCMEDLKAGKTSGSVLERVALAALDTPMDGGDLVKEAAVSAALEKELRDRIAGIRPSSTVPTGLPGVDDMLNGGMRKGETYVVAADTGVGKTAAALQVATTALARGMVVLMCSMEMAAIELQRRLLAQRTGIPLSCFGELGLSDKQQQAVWPVLAELKRSFWYRTGPQRLNDIATAARKVRRSERGRLDLIIVDYLQLVIHGIPGRKREEEVAAISRGVKALASQLDIPVLSLSQVNAEGSPRESNAIRHDAGAVIHLVPQPTPLHHTPRIEVEVRKNRYGMVGTTKALFYAHRMWFEDERETT